MKKYKSSKKRKLRIKNKPVIKLRIACPYCEKKFYQDSKHFFNCAIENNLKKSEEEIIIDIYKLIPFDKPKETPVIKIKKFTITKSFLRTKSGPFTKKQLNVLGVEWPLEKNWIKNSIGKQISFNTKKKFEKLRPTKKKKKHKAFLKSKSTKKDKKDNKEKLNKLMSNEAMKVYLQLTKMEVKFSIEKYFDDCVNPKTNMRLPFDFYLPKHNTLIEYDGKQHFEYVKKFHGDNEEEGKKLLIEQKYRDKIKDQYCIKKGLTLIRISYKEKNKVKTILESKIAYVEKIL